MHDSKHPLAGKTVRVKKTATHRQFPNFGGSEFHLEDWWDHLTGGSWMFADGNPACLIFALRSLENSIPTDDEVVYGHMPNGLGALLHVSEIES